MRYATIADFEDFMGPSWSTDDQDALLKLLDEATRDVDRALGNRLVVNDEGNTIDVAGITPFELNKLVEATCAQAEYRYYKGDTFFVEWRPENQSGPDGSVEGKEPYLGPKARAALTDGRLFRLTGGPGHHPLWGGLPRA